MPQGEAKRRRLLPRLNLTTLLVLVAVVGGSAGWYAYSVRMQRQTVRALRDAGARVIYDWEWDPGAAPLRSNGKALTGWRRIVSDRFGPDAVSSVAAVSTRGVRVGDYQGATDEHIALIGRLKSIRRLGLGAFAASEEGSSPIAGLKQLECFEIYDSRGKSKLGPILSRFGEHPRLKDVSVVCAEIDAADFDALAQLARLETLVVSNRDGAIGDADFAKLAGLGRLKTLGLSRTRITSEGLKPIGRMKSLESVTISESSIDDLAPFLQLPALKQLGLGDCRVGDGDLPALAGMPNLATFALGSSLVTDAGMAHLRHLPALKSLLVRDTPITDAGLQSLGAIKTLKQLSLIDTKITPEGIREFAKAHPGIFP